MENQLKVGNIFIAYSDFKKNRRNMSPLRVILTSNLYYIYVKKQPDFVFLSNTIRIFTL